MVWGLAMMVVTGAFGYTGRYIARLLLSSGHRVRTLTNHPDRPNPFGSAVEVRPLAFDRPEELSTSLAGARCLFNTYWVRFSHGETTFEQAVENTGRLIAAAGEACVERLVHLSIVNPQEGSPLPYFRGKAVVEKAVISSGLSHAIVRPTVIFGGRDIFINNIAWLLRRFPIFAVPGTGDYRLQPVFVEDVARICVEAGAKNENLVEDAAGPEILTFEELVRLIAGAVGSEALIVHAPPSLSLLLTRLVGCAVRDVVLN
ncbi:MAG: SDR family oxidoreductase, partial [Candidatus Methylomirabilales bacterium]